MLCKNCENEIPENKTVCANCGTAVSFKSSDRKRKNFPGSRKNKNKQQNNITYVALSDNKATDESIDVSIVKNNTLIENIKTDETTHTDSNFLTDKATSADKSSAPADTAAETEKKDDNYTTVYSCNDYQSQRNSYVPIGAEYVKTDRELPKAANIHTMSSSGIIYEIAEELYRKEKTASEIEALCQPPFKRVFDKEQIEKLDMEAKEKTRTLIANISDPEPSSSLKQEIPKDKAPISTASAFLIQLLFFIPVINLVTAFYYSFSKNSNYNKKAYSRAFLIFSLIFMAGALVFFAVYFFKTPSNHAKVIQSIPFLT